MSTRREFLGELTALGGLTAATSLAMLPDSFGPSTAAAQEPPTARRRPPDHRQPERTPPPAEYSLPPLPYAYDALEPYIDAQTMQIHHGKHHAGYVAGLNAAMKKLAESRNTGDFSNIQQVSRLLAFHAGGYFNHIIFWNNMAPPRNGGGGKARGALSAAISRDFSGNRKFRLHFTAATAAVEGNGWGVLGWHPALRRLVIMTMMNQQDLVTTGLVPLLMCDVWEHAYYLKYQNRRAEYIDAWWNVVNWRNVEERFEAAISRD